MKFNKNVLLVIFTSITISSLSYAMNKDDFKPSRSAQRRARKKANKAAVAAVEHEAVRTDAPTNASEDIALSSAKPAPAENPIAVQHGSFFAKIKRNKLNTFAIILALVETADVTQAYFLKTTKEELQDKTAAQKAKLIAQKTYTAALLGAAKNSFMNKVVPCILDLKQKAQDYLNKKKQAA